MQQTAICVSKLMKFLLIADTAEECSRKSGVVTVCTVYCVLCTVVCSYTSYDC